MKISMFSHVESKTYILNSTSVIRFKFFFFIIVAKNVLSMQFFVDFTRIVPCIHCLFILDISKCWKTEFGAQRRIHDPWRFSTTTHRRCKTRKKLWFRKRFISSCKMCDYLMWRIGLLEWHINWWSLAYWALYEINWSAKNCGRQLPYNVYRLPLSEKRRLHTT